MADAYTDNPADRAAIRAGLAKVLPSIVGKSAVAVPLTGSTSETTLATIAIAAGSMGPDGVVEVDAVLSWTNNANNKTIRFKLGGGTFFQAVVTTTASGRFQSGVQNRGSDASQVGAAASVQGSGVSGSAVVTLTIDTALAQNLTITGTLANAADTITLERYVVRVIPT